MAWLSAHWLSLANTALVMLLGLVHYEQGHR